MRKIKVFTRFSFMEGYDLTRFLFLRAIGFIYLIGFLNIVNQYLPLLGDRGLLPLKNFIPRVRFFDTPSLFHWNHSDRMVRILGWLGLILACIATSGLSDLYGFSLFIPIWLTLWILYLSFVNVGQTFYGFGWESMLLETGFLCIFLGPQSVQTPVVLIWLVRWILFRTMFGAGLIKLRGDRCWKDLTCLFYYYETQPIPNPMSRWFHNLPKFFQKFCVGFNHFVELIVPFFFFFPQPFAAIAGLFTVYFQLMLIISGNLSWLNYLTIALCISCFDDTMLHALFPFELPPGAPIEGPFLILISLYILLVLTLSIRPLLNLLQQHQLMNYSFEPFHLVNTYGAFGSITKRRNEIILQGTNDDPEDPKAVWKEYEFKGKPGDVTHRPCLMSPYHYRLDWLMWFAAMGSYHYYPWIVHLIAKLLKGDPAILGLLAKNPFPDGPPLTIQAKIYEYHFADPKSGKWWIRSNERDYLPPLSLDHPDLREYMHAHKWG